MTEGSYSKHDTENLRIIIGFCKDIKLLTELHGRSEKAFRENISLQLDEVPVLKAVCENILKELEV